jgi:hypothetical protein
MFQEKHASKNMKSIYMSKLVIHEFSVVLYGYQVQCNLGAIFIFENCHMLDDLFSFIKRVMTLCHMIDHNAHFLFCL